MVENNIYEMTFDKDSGLLSFTGEMSEVTREMFLAYLMSDIKDADLIKILDFSGVESPLNIGTRCFSQCSAITEIIFPDSLVTIGDEAFEKYTSLETLQLLNVENRYSIEKGAFVGCSSLKKVMLSSNIAKIGQGAFMGCGSLDEFTIFESENSNHSGNITTTIENMAFWWCQALERIDFSGMTSSLDIAEKVFDCRNSLQEIVFPKKMRHIGELAFFQSPKLKSLDMSVIESEFAIGKGAFAEMPSLKSVIFPKHITSIGDRAFYKCEELENIDFSDVLSLKEIESASFYECGVKSVQLPAGLKIIGEQAFGECRNLSMVEIPDTVEKIGDYAFDGSKLRSIILPSSLNEMPTLGDKLEKLRTIDLSKVSEVNEIDNAIIAGEHKVKELIIPAGVVTLEDDVIFGIDTIYLPPTIQSVGDNPADNIYCFAEELQDMDMLFESLEDDDKIYLYVLPEYIDNYTELRDIEDIDERRLIIDVIPDEKRFIYEH